MMPIVIDVEQGSEEWHTARLGRLTSSHAAEMMATIKRGEAASRRNLRVKLVLERITGKPLDHGAWSSKAMDRGHELEPDALAAYEALTGTMVEQVGFITLGRCMAGGSPDGLVGANGGVEVKCPLAATHLEYLTTGKMDNAYKWQNIHNLWVTGRDWWDWLSFHPDFADIGLDIKLVRIERDDKAISEYEERALEFLAEVDEQEAALREMAPSSDGGPSENAEENSREGQSGEEVDHANNVAVSDSTEEPEIPSPSPAASSDA